MRWRSTALLALACGLAACSEDGVTPLSVVRVGPRLAEAQRTLFLNQSLVVEFSAPVDPASIRAPAFRVYDGDGPIEGEIEVRDRTVWFRPTAPIGPALDDGSFRPGTTVQLEMSGLPRSTMVRDRSGHALSESVVVTFQVPDRDPGGDGRELFLDNSVGSPLGLRLDLGPPRLSLGSRELLLEFTHPPLPTTVTPDAFVLQRLPKDGREVVPVRVERAEVLDRWRPEAREPGTTVRLALGPELADPESGDLFLAFERDPSKVLRSRGGRAIQTFDALAVARPRLAWRELGIESVGDAPGFELVDGEPVPRIRRVCGDASAGRFVAGRSPEPSRDRLQFRSFVVPAGQRVVLDLEGEPAVLRSLGAIRVDGELVLRNVPPGAPWSPSESPSSVSVVRDASFAMLGAGPIRIGGRLRVESTDGAAGEPAIALVGAERVDLEGELPLGVLISVERGGFTLGAAEGLISHQIDLAPGLAEGTRAVWKAQTGWLPLPVAGSGELVFRLQHPQELRVAVELRGPGVRGRRRPFSAGEVVCPLGDATDFRLRLETEQPFAIDGAELGTLSVRLR